MSADKNGAPGWLRQRTAEEIRVLLARKRMSAAELARRTGLKQSTLARRMTGEIPFDLDDLELIARELDVEVADLLPRTASAGIKDGKEQVSRTDRHGRRTAPAQPGHHTTPQPFGPSRPVTPRPVSGVPARLRRPTRTRPGERPIPA